MGPFRGGKAGVTKSSGRNSNLQTDGHRIQYWLASETQWKAIPAQIAVRSRETTASTRQTWTTSFNVYSSDSDRFYRICRRILPSQRPEFAVAFGSLCSRKSEARLRSPLLRVRPKISFAFRRGISAAGKARRRWHTPRISRRSNVASGAEGRRKAELIFGRALSENTGRGPREAEIQIGSGPEFSPVETVSPARRA